MYWSFAVSAILYSSAFMEKAARDSRIQALFDLYGIRYTGTGHASSALCMDKSITKEMFRCYHVPTPAGITVRSEEELILPEDFTYPCMVKTCCGGSSVGVYRVENEDELHVALKEAFTYEDHVIIEKCIIGREFSIAVVEGKALPVIEIAPLTGFYDYKINIRQAVPLRPVQRIFLQKSPNGCSSMQKKPALPSPSKAMPGWILCLIPSPWKTMHWKSTRFPA